jgi:hypothetical protein
MSVLVFEKIFGVNCQSSFQLDGNVAVEANASAQPLRQHQLLAQIGLEAPPAGQVISIWALDNALAGMPVDRRLEIKCRLRDAGLIN